MKKIKAISIAMASILALGTLCGCQGKKTGSNGVTEVVIWSANSSEKAVMNELVNKFNNSTGKEKGVKVVWELKENNMTQQLEVAMQNGTEPDIFSGGTLSKLAEQDKIVALEDIPELAEMLEKNGEVKADGWNTYNGKTYFLAASAQLYGLAYNKDMFKAAGIVDEKGDAKPPTTIAEMLEDAKKLTNPDKQEYGFIAPVKWGGWYGCEIQAPAQGSSGMQDGVYDVKTGTYDYSGVKPIAEAFMQMKKDGSLYPGAESMDNDPARARFAEGNIGMKMAVSWDVGVWNDQFPTKCDWGIAPIPVADENNAYKQVKSAGWTNMISKKGLEEKGADKIAIVYNWLWGDDVLKEKCEKSVLMPWREDIVEKVNFEGTKKGWEDFANILKISTAQQPGLSRDMSGHDSIGTDFVNRVWSGQVSFDDWAKEVSGWSNDGVKKYKELHPDVDQSDRIKPEWDIKLN